MKKNLFSLFIALFCISLINSELISQTVLTEGLEAPNRATDVIFYNDNLIVVVGVEDGNSESQASLIQYDSNGAIAKRLLFPLNAESIEVSPLNIHDNFLYIIVYDEDGYGNHFNVYEVDLDTFSITNSKDNIKPPQKGYDGHTPNEWLPFSATSSYWQYANELELVSLFPFSLQNLTEGTEELFLPFNYVQYGGAVDSLSADNLLFGCGEKFRLLDPLGVIFFVYDVEKKEVSTQFHSSTGDCGIATFMGDTTQVVYGSNGPFEEGPWLHLSVFDVNDPSIEGQNVNGTAILEATQIIRMYADQSNIFLFGEVNNYTDGYYSFGDNTTIFQIQYSESDNSFAIIDHLEVPTGYGVENFENYNPIQTYSLGSKQFAAVLNADNYYNNQFRTAVLLVDYN